VLVIDNEDSTEALARRGHRALDPPGECEGVFHAGRSLAGLGYGMMTQGVNSGSIRVYARAAEQAGELPKRPRAPGCKQRSPSERATRESLGDAGTADKRPESLYVLAHRATTLSRRCRTRVRMASVESTHGISEIAHELGKAPRAGRP